MKYYIIAGEASGDLHGSNLMKAIKEKDPDARFRVWGGDMMQKQGGEIVKHINELAFMGFVEVLRNLKTILGNIRLCKNDILSNQPDCVIFVDYPGFNLRIARFCKTKGIRTIYYISPQVWAWDKSRVKAIKRDVDKMLVILPFEQDFYKSYGYDVDFVGHPLLDALEGATVKSTLDKTFAEKNGLDPLKPVIAILPGSRKQEISRMLPVMSKVTALFPDHQFIVAGTKAHDLSFYHSYMNGARIPVVFGMTYELLSSSRAAMVTSGTATLETALIGVPQVVCYKAGQLSYMIARRLVKIKYISLVNLIMDDEIVTELIQHEMNPDRLGKELGKIAETGEIRMAMIEKYAKLRQKLGGSGASEKAADSIARFLNQ